MDKGTTYAEQQLEDAYQSLQIAKLLVDHFKEDFENMTRDVDDNVKVKAFGLFQSALYQSIYTCHL